MTFTADQLEKMIDDYVSYWAAYEAGSSEACSSLYADKANKLSKNMLDIAQQLLDILKSRTEEIQGSAKMKEADFYAYLASQGIRIFMLKLGLGAVTYIHPRKSTEEWRADVKRFKDEINRQSRLAGLSDNDIYVQLFTKMVDAGYLEVPDLASDVYEGRIAIHTASIVDAPIHGGQADSFGHHGWEAKGI